MANNTKTKPPITISTYHRRIIEFKEALDVVSENQHCLFREMQKQHKEISESVRIASLSKFIAEDIQAIKAILKKMSNKKKWKNREIQKDDENA